MAGLCMLGSYLLGTIPFGYLITRRRFRRRLRSADVATILTGTSSSTRDELLSAILDTAKVLVAATVSWHLVKTAAPGFDRHFLPRVSAVGFLADQVLTSWQSMALWAGLAAVVGHLAPPWLGFRGRQGQAPALGLVLAYCPFGFSVGVLTFVAFRLARLPVVQSVVISVGGFVLYAWLAWIFDWQTAWGAFNGPELALWATVLAGVIAADTIARGDREAPPPPAA